MYQQDPQPAAGSAAVAAAWFPDPYVPGQLRWWDGVQWSEHVHREEPAAPQPLQVQQPAVQQAVTQQPAVQQAVTQQSAVQQHVAPVVIPMAMPAAAHLAGSSAEMAQLERERIELERERLALQRRQHEDWNDRQNRRDDDDWGDRLQNVLAVFSIARFFGVGRR